MWWPLAETIKLVPIKEKYETHQHDVLTIGAGGTEMEQILLNGKIIERYRDAQPYPACLVLASLDLGDPLHIVCSRKH